MRHGHRNLAPLLRRPPVILLIIPGPIVLLVVSYALGQGWRAAFCISLRVALGDFTAMTLSSARRGRAVENVGGVVFRTDGRHPFFCRAHSRKLWRAGGALPAGRHAPAMRGPLRMAARA